MNTWAKVGIGVLGLILVLFILTLIPLPQKWNGSWHESAILEFRTYYGLGFSYESFEIHKAGYFKYNKADEPAGNLTEEQMSYINTFLDGKKYTYTQRSLLSKWMEGSSNGVGKSSFLVNQGGDFLVIDFDKGLYDIVKSLRTQVKR